MQIYTTALPGSDVSGASVVFRSAGYERRYGFGPEIQLADTIDLGDRHRAVDFELALESRGDQSSVYLKKVPVAAQIVLIGISPTYFQGIILHEHEIPNAALTCELRCTPESKPVLGPGCITCKRKNLSFQICC
jgi:hypothetical protein